MRICVLNDPAWGGFDPAHYLRRHTFELIDIRKETAVATIREIARRGCFDLVLNLCDGAFDEPRPGLEVVQALERFSLPYTGPDAHFYEPSREAMKIACESFGLRVPASTQVRGVEDLAEVAAAGLRYPLLVKHPNSYGSTGLEPGSRVEDEAALGAQVARMVAAWGGALVEEFIEGPEYSVLVAEDPEDTRTPVAYRPIEILFPPGERFKHEHLKWTDYERMRCVPVEDPALDRRLRDMARKVFIGLDGTGFGRCDIRADRDGILHLLEINPNGAILYPPGLEGMSDFILTLDPAGHDGFLDRLFSAALARHRRRARPFRVRYCPPIGHGLVATHPIAAGETIERIEDRPLALLARARALHGLDEDASVRLRRVAFPITDDLLATPARHPDAFRPILHACDPSAWLDGFDLVARRPIAPGGPITIDYATLFADDLPPFRCRCGAASCRGVIRGEDHLTPVVERYGPHLSPYVRARRAAAGRP